jgi:DNA-directed RNA polymerase subunit RPC12/RpoP
MIDIDLYTKFICIDCLHEYLLSGSTAVNLIQCPKCQSKNWEDFKTYKRLYPNLKQTK